MVGLIPSEPEAFAATSTVTTIIRLAAGDEG